MTIIDNMRRLVLAAAAALVLLPVSANAQSDEAMQERLTNLEDRVAIQALLSRYPIALNTSDPEMYSSLFTEDATLIVAGKTFEGHEEIEAMIAKGRERWDLESRVADPHGYIFIPIRHIVTPAMITLDGDTAMAESYSLELASSGRDETGMGRPPHIMNYGRYQDDLVKVDGEWLIAKRNIIIDLFGEIPGGRIDLSGDPQVAGPTPLSP